MAACSQFLSFPANKCNNVPFHRCAAIRFLALAPLELSISIQCEGAVFPYAWRRVCEVDGPSNLEKLDWAGWKLERIDLGAC